MESQAQKNRKTVKRENQAQKIGKLEERKNGKLGPEKLENGKIGKLGQGKLGGYAPFICKRQLHERTSVVLKLLRKTQLHERTSAVFKLLQCTTNMNINAFIHINTNLIEIQI